MQRFVEQERSRPAARRGRRRQGQRRRARRAETGAHNWGVLTVLWTVEGERACVTSQKKCYPSTYLQYTALARAHAAEPRKPVDDRVAERALLALGLSSSFIPFVARRLAAFAVPGFEPFGDAVLFEPAVLVRGGVLDRGVGFAAARRRLCEPPRAAASSSPTAPPPGRPCRGRFFHASSCGARRRATRRRRAARARSEELAPDGGRRRPLVDHEGAHTGEREAPPPCALLEGKAARQLGVVLLREPARGGVGLEAVEEQRARDAIEERRCARASAARAAGRGRGRACRRRVASAATAPPTAPPPIRAAPSANPWRS